jgi:CRISP-associated protein Cas1
VVILEHRQITISHALLDALLQSNVALITCDETMMPSGLMLPLAGGNTVQTERFRAQIDASEPLKKNLWMQTVAAKLHNQARHVRQVGRDHSMIEQFARSVTSGDSDNLEARGAAMYWSLIFAPELQFRRDRYGEPPNHLLNYGYAILRACTARALVASGLLPTLGIHHRNKYNAYCLADDIMEPYRPMVDQLVCQIMREQPDYSELTRDTKATLLTIMAVDVHIDGERSPLMVALAKTTASLVKCYEGDTRKILYPELPE